MRRRFITLDVFTAERFAGNPLAVVLDTEGLDEHRMQAVAREFALSETVFVLPAEDPRHRARLRIFTPARELPFAGHPTVGAAVVLASGGARTNGAEQAFVVEEGAGPVPCTVRLGTDGAGEAMFRTPRVPARDGIAESHEAISAALGLAVYDIGFDAHVPTRYSAGTPFIFVPVRDLAAIGRVRVNAARWHEAFPRDPVGAFVYTRETACESASFHARMFAPFSGVAEDPATGSAVAALAGVLVEFEPNVDGAHAYVVEQGYEMGRPSQIRLEMELRRRSIAEVRVGGHAVPVSEGTIEA